MGGDDGVVTPGCGQRLGTAQRSGPTRCGDRRGGGGSVTTSWLPM